VGSAEGYPWNPVLTAAAIPIAFQILDEFGGIAMAFFRVRDRIRGDRDQYVPGSSAWKAVNELYQAACIASDMADKEHIRCLDLFVKLKVVPKKSPQQYRERVSLPFAGRQ
jgi:hypothetical protein